jgi:hypothetical protein
VVPLVFSIACLGYVHRDKIIDQYTAAYPSDPAKQAAMQQCIEHDKNFNRLDADDRQACYRQYIAPTAIAAAPVAAGPSPAPYYPYSPSHLPGNDIRRQEANDGYHPLIRPLRPSRYRRRPRRRRHRHRLPGSITPPPPTASQRPSPVRAISKQAQTPSVSSCPDLIRASSRRSNVSHSRCRPLDGRIKSGHDDEN